MEKPVEKQAVVEKQKKQKVVRRYFIAVAHDGIGYFEINFSTTGTTFSKAFPNRQTLLQTIANQSQEPGVAKGAIINLMEITKKEYKQWTKLAPREDLN